MDRPIEELRREWIGRHVASLLKEAVSVMEDATDGDREQAARRVAIAAARYHTKIKIGAGGASLTRPNPRAGKRAPTPTAPGPRREV